MALICAHVDSGLQQRMIHHREHLAEFHFLFLLHVFLQNGKPRRRAEKTAFPAPHRRVGDRFHLLYGIKGGRASARFLFLFSRVGRILIVSRQAGGIPMIIGMRGHDFGRIEPRALAAAIRETGFEATQLAFTKAFPAPAEQYMTREALCDIREAFAGLALPVMGCYVSAERPRPRRAGRSEGAFQARPVRERHARCGLRRHGNDPFHLPGIRTRGGLRPPAGFHPRGLRPRASRSTRWWALSRSRCTRSIRRS